MTTDSKLGRGPAFLVFVLLPVTAFVTPAMGQPAVPTQGDEGKASAQAGDEAAGRGLRGKGERPGKMRRGEPGSRPPHRKQAHGDPRVGKGPHGDPRVGKGPHGGPRVGKGPHGGPRVGKGPHGGPRVGKGPHGGPGAGQPPQGKQRERERRGESGESEAANGEHEAVRAGHAGSPLQLKKRRRTARVRLRAAEMRGAERARKRARRRLESGADKSPQADSADKGAREARRRAKWEAIKAALGDKRKPDVQLNQELRRHARRVAKLARIAALAEADEKADFVARVQALMERERARHASTVERLTEAAALAEPDTGAEGDVIEQSPAVEEAVVEESTGAGPTEATTGAASDADETDTAGDDS